MGAKLDLEDLLLPPMVSSISWSLIALLVAVLLCAVAITVALYLRYQQRRYCRIGLRTLTAMDDNTLAQLWPLKQLLQQVIRAYQPHALSVQPASGKAWFDNLAVHLPSKLREQISPLQLLADDQRFKADFSASTQVPALRAAAAYWLQHTRLPHHRTTAATQQNRGRKDA
ncbi:DUF4381 family protein [Corallincola holothuriorum]|uniref:DUF4381 family protein n=1 Tax=Corallincola holothuriorum TaxID=2282215 RepID=A0A368NHN8_9GAMM|nr:DUF4381 family protein [Corallincola holothuriorum]RCU48901.1 DUF4381 family protein [Corallincola holothuriorum]